MKRFSGRIGAALFLVGSLAAVCPAAIIQSSTGLPGAAITFDEIVMAVQDPITTEYLAYGISFSSGTKYDANGGATFPGVTGHHVGNFPPVTDPWSIFFTSDQTTVAFGIATNPNTTTVTALLNGSVVESASIPTDFFTPAYGFVIVSGITFDEIRLSTTADQLALVDNIQMQAAVPEPSTLALFGLGTLGLALGRRRLSRRA
jgi:hypothetical protein